MINTKIVNTRIRCAIPIVSKQMPLTKKKKKNATDRAFSIHKVTKHNDHLNRKLMKLLGDIEILARLKFPFS